MNKAARERLAKYERSYKELASRLTDIGLISSGSVVRRSMRCGTKTCRCHVDPARMHGPYYQWTAKVDGKTVTKRLTEHEAQLYQEWIANDRKLGALIEKMRKVAAKAEALILKEAVETQG